ncbi:hypothetical protein BVC80_8833g20 [Macleaya cordata]|uniref:Uncharacterized protein n=1 Tax=Macleaya cordata TaxID=56857 RepID=A0A200QTU4_MACCD|nr:hypothetical protein BVC80_8833g20 [Macleaya cordata]
MECNTFQRVMLDTFMLRGAVKIWWRGRLAPFQIRSYIEAVSKALSIEREDEDIQATRGQMGRPKQLPQQFQTAMASSATSNFATRSTGYQTTCTCTEQSVCT